MSIMDNVPVKKSSSSSSSTTITDLSDDLLSEIITKLPFRSTSRCKCVSKRWLNLVSNRSFIRLFMENQTSLFFAFMIFLSPQQLMLTFPPASFDSGIDDDDGGGDEIYPLHESEKKTLLSPEVFIKGNICGCSENVFLCSDNRYTSGHGFFLCDPLTKETLQVPSLETRKNRLYAVGFICGDPFKTHDQEEISNNNNNDNDQKFQNQNWTGLEPKRCFRVVMIRSFIISLSEFEVDVWCVETEKWNTHSVRCRNGFAFAPHWSLSFAYERRLYFMGRTSIFVYDPFGYNGDTLFYPQDSDPMNIMSFGFLGSSCGKLRISEIGHTVLRVWELLNENWELVYHVNFSEYLPAEFCNNYYKHVGGFHPHDGEIVYLHSYADGIFVANLETMKFFAIPGYENTDLSPFHLEVPFSHQ